MSTKTKRKTPRGRANAAGNRLMAALEEVHRAVTSGDTSTLAIHQVEIPEPGRYDATAVRATRRRLGVSQAVFGRLVGVSPQLVEHWEQGRRVPAPLARRLLDKINEDPSSYLESLVKRTVLRRPSV